MLIRPPPAAPEPPTLKPPLHEADGNTVAPTIDGALRFACTWVLMFTDWPPTLVALPFALERLSLAFAELASVDCDWPTTLVELLRTSVLWPCCWPLMPTLLCCWP